MTCPEPPGPIDPRATDLLDTCPVCSGAGPVFFLWGRSRYTEYWFRYDRCPGCDLVFLNPRIPETDLTQALQGRQRSYLKYLPTRSFDTAEADLNLIRPTLRLHALPAGHSVRWLDVGCGIGNLLRAAHHRGCRCWGVDADRSLIEWAEMNATGIDFSCGTLENLSPEEPFDVISADNVLEHITEPVAFLRCVNRNLAEGGLLVVRVPNFDSLFRRIASRRGTLATSFVIDPDAHPINYSRKPLLHLLAVCGFEPVRVSEHLMVSYALRRVLNHLSPRTSQRFQHVLKPALPLLGWIDRCFPKGGLNITVFARKSSS